MFLKIALSPLLAAQALYVIRKALVLPEPGGPRLGQTGSGPPLRLLILGDSSVAGVGAAHQSRALSGQLPALLGQDFSVSWQLTAQTGATSKSTLKTLAALPDQSFDAVFIGLGVNDVTRLVPAKTWLKQQREMHALLRSRFQTKLILRSGLPPMGHFPLLPQPLRRVLGQDAARLDKGLKELCATDNTTDKTLSYIPLDLPFEPKYIARDGFHPSEAAYTKWAELIAPHILNPDFFFL